MASEKNPLAIWDRLKKTEGATLAQGGESAKFDAVGDIVAGTVLEHTEITVDGKTRGVTRLRATEAQGGKLLLLWHAGNLPSLLDGVPVGANIAVAYVGDKPAKQRGFSPMKLYEVLILPDEFEGDADLPF